MRSPLQFPLTCNEIKGMAGFSHFGSEWGKTVSQPTLLIVIIVKKDYLCAAQVNSFISGNALLTCKFDPAQRSKEITHE